MTATPTLRAIFVAVQSAVDRPVSLHATDADWRAVQAELAALRLTWADLKAYQGMKLYSTTLASRVTTASGREILLDPPVWSAPSPVPNFPERRRCGGGGILADHQPPKVSHARS